MGKKHAKKFVKCEDCVMYEIPLSYGRVYVGKRGRCVNERLRTHPYTMRAGTGSNRAIHCVKCDCYPKLKETCILKRYCGVHCGEIYEASAISIWGEDGVSLPSVDS